MGAWAAASDTRFAQPSMNELMESSRALVVEPYLPPSPSAQFVAAGTRTEKPHSAAVARQLKMRFATERMRATTSRSRAREKAAAAGLDAENAA